MTAVPWGLPEEVADCRTRDDEDGRLHKSVD